MKVVGEKPLMPFLTELDNIKMGKVGCGFVGRVGLIIGFATPTGSKCECLSLKVALQLLLHWKCVVLTQVYFVQQFHASKSTSIYGYEYRELYRTSVLKYC